MVHYARRLAPTTLAVRLARGKPRRPCRDHDAARPGLLVAQLNNWYEIRTKPQYAGWPPHIALTCKRCGLEFHLTRSGRAHLAHARRVMRTHKCDPAPWLHN